MKNILVTGCSRGVGIEICSALLEQGNNVYGISRTYSEEFKKLQLLFPNQLHYFCFDLENTDGVKAIFTDWLKNTICIDGFINNAAIAYDDIISNMNADSLRKMYAVNVFTPLMMTKYAIRNMIFNKVRGSIVHMSSISVHTGYKGLSMYASSKGALEAFSKNTAREWGEKGIRSNCLVAGFMDTEMSSTLTQEQRDRIYKRNSLKQPTSIRSVANTICFLLSDQSVSLTGQNIFVDAGTI